MRIAILLCGGLIAPAVRADDMAHLFGQTWTDNLGTNVTFVRTNDNVAIRVGRGDRTGTFAVQAISDGPLSFRQPGYGCRIDVERIDGGQFRLRGFLLTRGRFPVPIRLTGTYVPPRAIRRDRLAIQPASPGPIRASEGRAASAELERRVAKLAENTPSVAVAPTTGTRPADLSEHTVDRTPNFGGVAIAIGAVLAFGLLGLVVRPRSRGTTHAIRNPFEGDRE